MRPQGLGGGGGSSLITEMPGKIETVLLTHDKRRRLAVDTDAHCADVKSSGGAREKQFAGSQGKDPEPPKCRGQNSILHCRLGSPST